MQRYMKSQDKKTKALLLHKKLHKWISENN